MTPADYDEYCIVAPLNSQLPGGGGNQTCGLYDLNPAKLAVTPNNLVEVRQISLGLETASKVEVRSGLNEGDLVVIGGRAALQAGQEVRPKVTAMVAAKQ